VADIAAGLSATQHRLWLLFAAGVWANRRLARSVEGGAETVRAFFQIAMIKLMTRRIARYG
jgi:hypothetical protein